jgi:uncharacterized alpha-E superfamily protein
VRLLARNAEALFWLARYLERAASLARVIEMQSAFGVQEAGWNWLLALHTDEERFKERFEVSAANIIAFYLTDQANPGSIRASIHWARENARSLRPFIPTEMWGQLNTFYGAVQKVGNDDIVLSKLPQTCSQIRVGCLAQIGIAEGTLFRDEGYQFFRLGLMIERADQTSRLLDVKFAQNLTTTSPADPADDFVFWSTILRTAGAYQVFHRLEPERASPERVARFLILNPSHPRSIGYCAREIGDALNMLRAGFNLSRASACLEDCEKLMGGLQAAGRDTKLADHLHGFNDWIQRALIELNGDISTAFFQAPVPPPKAATQPAPEPNASSVKEPQTGTAQNSQTQTQHQS